MKRLLSLCFLLVSQVIWAATGDVKWLSIETIGFGCDVCFASFGTGGTYAMGLGLSNSLTGTEKLRVTVSSPGYDDTGAATTLSRTVVGEMRMRQPYPSQATPYEIVSGSDVICRFAMSDFVHSNDTITAASVAAGLYTYSATPNNASNLVSANYTNYSAVPTPRVLAMWSDVPYQQVGATYTLRCVAFHYSAQQGRPVRCVQFWGVDSAGNRGPTNTVLYPTIDYTQGDAVPVVEYVASMSSSAFTQGLAISNYFKACPWYGNALDCSDGKHEPTHPDYAPFVTYCNKAGTWKISIALVDTNASGAGYAVTNWTLATNGTALPFATIGAALNAAAATNNTFNGDNSLNNCYILMTNGGYSVWGTAVTSVNQSTNWAHVMARPDVNWSNVFLNALASNQTGQKNMRLHVAKCILNTSANSGVWSEGYGQIWLDNMILATNSGAAAYPINFSTNMWITHCTFQKWRAVPQVAGGSYTNAFLKFRGCTFNGFSADGYTSTYNPALFIGNLVNPPYTEQFGLVNDAPTLCDPGIWAFNAIYNQDELNYAAKFGINGNITNGFVFVNNLIETTTNSGSSVPYDVMNSQVNNEWCTNVLSWYNTVTSRYHPPFNLGGYYMVSCDHYQDVGQLDGAREFKSDISDTSANSTNRWSLTYSVGCYANATGQIGLATNSSAFWFPSSKELGFDGLGSMSYYQTNGFIFKWVSNLSQQGGTALGNGDYHLRTDSPIVQYPAAVLNSGPVKMPFDVQGVGRYPVSPSGAYATGCPGVGGHFFSL